MNCYTLIKQKILAVITQLQTKGELPAELKVDAITVEPPKSRNSGKVSMKFSMLLIKTLLSFIVCSTMIEAAEPSFKDTYEMVVKELALENDDMQQQLSNQDYLDKLRLMLSNKEIQQKILKGIIQGKFGNEMHSSKLSKLLINALNQNKKLTPDMFVFNTHIILSLQNKVLFQDNVDLAAAQPVFNFWICELSDVGVALKKVLIPHYVTSEDTIKESDSAAGFISNVDDQKHTFLITEKDSHSTSYESYYKLYDNQLILLNTTKIEIMYCRDE